MSAVCAACGEVAAELSRFCEGCGAPLAVADPDGPGADQGGSDPAGPGADSGHPAVKIADPDGDEDDDAADGAPIPPARPCASCGGTVAADGYCELCGEPAASERDHWVEHPADHVAGVCDRGLRHARNEDAMALHVDGAFAALVVCDGVSSAPDSDVASLAAARAARDVLATGAPRGTEPVTGGWPVRLSAWSALLGRATEAANAAIVDTVGDAAHREDPPSCTFAAAVVDGPLVVAGWLGDSRVYWIPDTGTPLQLSVDDSWANEMMQRGVSRASAEASQHAHAITRWLGPDAESTVPSTAPTRAQTPGWVLVCSDGLWNYCSAAPDLAELLHRTVDLVGPSPEAVAAELVRWANDQGGRDNITAALARLDAHADAPFDSLDAERTASPAPPAL